MNKRKLTALLSVVALAALLATGSLAYFTAQDSITNTFMTASYTPDGPVSPEDTFSIVVKESGATEGKTYEGILPADVLSKDPTVENTGAYEQYVRVKVTVSDYAAWSRHLQGAGVNSLWNLQSGWTLDTAAPVVDSAADTITYTYFLDSKLAPDASATLFTTVTIPSYFNVAELTDLCHFTISIAADAIQTAHTGDSAQEAFAGYWS